MQIDLTNKMLINGTTKTVQIHVVKHLVLLLNNPNNPK